MKEATKDKIETVAAASIGAGVGGEFGATAGVLELASQGILTGLSARVAIGVGAYRWSAHWVGRFQSLPAPQKAEKLSFTLPSAHVHKSFCALPCEKTTGASARKSR